MGVLAQAFLQALGAGHRVAGARRDEVKLEAHLETALAGGRAAWPRLIVSGPRFAAHLAHCVRGRSDPAGAIVKLCVADLFLTCACLSGSRGAAARFEELYRSAVSRSLTRVPLDAEVKEEVTQNFLARLLVGRDKGPAELGEYHGRGPLAKWLGIAVQRQALNAQRADRARRRLIDQLALAPAPAQLGLEDGFLGAHYKKPLEDALRAAVARLTSRQRVILRLNLVGGLTTVRIAKMYTVNQATISRWLANARDAVWSEVEAQLTRTLRLSASDVASLLRALAPNIDVSLGSALADATSGVRRSGGSSGKAAPSRSSSKSRPSDLS